MVDYFIVDYGIILCLKSCILLWAKLLPKILMFWVSNGCSHSFFGIMSVIQCGLKLEVSFCYQSWLFADNSCVLWPYLSVGILLLMYTTHSSVFTVSCVLSFSVYAISLSLTLYTSLYKVRCYRLSAFTYIAICISFRPVLNL